MKLLVNERKTDSSVGDFFFIPFPFLLPSGKLLSSWITLSRSTLPLAWTPLLAPPWCSRWSLGVGSSLRWGGVWGEGWLLWSSPSCKIQWWTWYMKTFCASSFTTCCLFTNLHSTRTCMEWNDPYSQSTVLVMMT